ncbi:ABC transporter ATP-binding protein [Nodularia sphaerocarpa]|uniref:ABC transporter ATP-binding protein n=1 Tax=Nodularia sphaerocarpa TaxID=137816 RepID=UPI001EFA4A16|nr:ABC transporter ATP-binding protein [Nodularia sphaerocarpa]MDB9372418.1 ABC transporter ATP-binding protein [Nodularia sphaerocarpa CS-585]MDB9379131.1 ABC transporter ATP-binding protein [Nodularia sphaerocarpa CS-585A2]ULP71016.1 Heterocyst differentiation ATP-binding protein HepA [Nodularia sphaerocarpa UHCC 0038]
MSTSKLLLKFAKPYPGWIVITILLGFSGALFNGVSTALIVPVILKIVGQEVDFTNAPPILKIIINPFDNVPENYRVGVMAGAILLTIIFKNIATYTSVLSSSSFTRMLTSDIRESGLKLLMEVDIDYYAKMKVGDLINSLGGEISRTANAMSNIIKLVILVITISVFVIILLSISWQLTVASAFLLSFVTLINQYAIYRSKSFGKQLSEMSKAYSIAVLETLNGIRLVKATGNEAKEYFRIKKLIRDREAADFQSQVNSQAIAPISEVMGIASLLVIIFLSRTFFSEQISTLSAVLLTYLLVLLRLLPLISQLNSLRSSFANSSTSVAIVTDFLNRDNKPFMNQGNIPYTTLQEGIHFKSLSFAYPGHQKLVLKDVDLFLPCGATLALVGGSGAGKSTLADLLPRFYDPVSGSINIDGRDLRDFDLISMRKKMGIVSQDTFLFNDTVQNNIAYGRPSATVDEIITAAKRANAYEFISNLPQEFETLIGDRGVMLSGGQRQRLAIARALLQNPEILILDEATSALDTVSERLVQAALDDLSRTRTTLVIAHRLSTVQKADQIAVLEQGRVVEVGTHQELLQRGGYYSRLYSMQFSDRPKISTKSSQSFIRISDELRTRFNSMIGFLNLLIDGMVANAQEQQELITKSYKSTLKTITTVDILEDIIQLQIQEQLLSSPHQNLITKYPTFEQIAEKARQHLHTIISILSFLDNSLKPIQPGKSKLIIESYHAAKSLIEDLEKFGNQIFKL